MLILCVLVNIFEDELEGPSAATSISEAGEGSSAFLVRFLLVASAIFAWKIKMVKVLDTLL